MKRTKFLGLIVALLMTAPAPRAQQLVASAAAVLVPTTHPRLPPELSRLWLAPMQGRSAPTAAVIEFAAEVGLEVDGNFTEAQPIFSQRALQQGALGHYAEYYKGLAELGLGRAADARRMFQALQAGEPVGYLVEAAAIGEAESGQALGDQAAALDVYGRYSQAYRRLYGSEGSDTDQATPAVAPASAEMVTPASAKSPPLKKRKTRKAA